MSHTLNDLAQWLQPLVQALEPAQCRTLAASIAKELRRQTQASMRAQTAPDGTPWQPRKPRRILRDNAAAARQRKGPMMARLRRTQNLPISATASEATLAFASRVARIADVHHHGLKDAVSIGGPEHVYAQRTLLGISDEGAQRIREQVLNHLQNALKK